MEVARVSMSDHFPHLRIFKVPCWMLIIEYNNLIFMIRKSVPKNIRFQDYLKLFLMFIKKSIILKQIHFFLQRFTIKSSVWESVCMCVGVKERKVVSLHYLARVIKVRSNLSDWCFYEIKLFFCFFFEKENNMFFFCF